MQDARSEKITRQLKSQGLDCFQVEPDGEIEKEAGRAAPDVILLLGDDRDALRAREGSSLARIPLVAAGEEDPGLKPDEQLPANAPEELLARRLHAWARWGSMARRLGEMETTRQEGSGADPLTGLPSHSRFMEQVQNEVQRHARYETPVGLVIADVEGMHALNERYGHDTGDSLLREIGETLRRAVRQTDIVGRLSGDTFALLLPESGPEETHRAVSRIRALVRNRIFRGESTGGGPPPLLRIALQFGAAALPEGNLRGAAGLVAAAEAALREEQASRRAEQASLP